MLRKVEEAQGAYYGAPGSTLRKLEQSVVVTSPEVRGADFRRGGARDAVAGGGAERHILGTAGAAATTAPSRRRR